MKRVVVVGTQWGDEGKGKITDYLTQKSDVVVRYQGGNNAGHTVVVDNKKYALHLLPSGVLNKNKINILANGMVINIEALLSELERIDVTEYQLYISNRAHITFPFHILEDQQEESQKVNKIGTTFKGIGPTYKDKADRIGVRIGDLYTNDFASKLKALVQKKESELNVKIDFLDIYNKHLDFANKIKPFVTDTSVLINELIEVEKTILFEGAQGVMLCLDHGTYPFVTSSSPTAASVPLNTGIALG
ncbi:MAG: adenylosuccinate synthetase [Acholeplasma sp.]|nr:adenylosuccinate synthetase [Acholeplasma sp.]